MKKILSLVLSLAMIFSLAACGASEAPAATEAPVVTAAPEVTPAPIEEPSYDNKLLINAMVLNGTTGFGMANLIHASRNNEAKLNYNFSVETDASNITAALVSGSVDIAALPTNAAATLYNQTQGQVLVLALNTLGVLYLLSDGSEEIKS
ncbi:MAG: ABC transporter substrate-binding protein, partial [Oscillospiraceae bacterium]|nr:ABC transporter substrate-binding protein [Oscillospiraceae bacterium]